MAYKGQSSVVQCSKGGLSGASNIDDLPNYMMVYPSRNILLEKNGRRKRRGTNHLYKAALPSGPAVLSVYDCTFNDKTQYIVAATDDGLIYQDDTTSILDSGWSTSNPTSFTMGENKLFAADGLHLPQVWTGAGDFAEIAHPAADWNSAPPFQLLLHTRAAAQAMLALNSTTLYISKTYAAAGDLEDFTNATVKTMFIDTEDGYGLQGMVEIGAEVIIFGRRKSYRVNDSSMDYFNWYYTPAMWTGGAASWRLIVKIPNDTLIMAEDGDIYSITAVSAYGDYKQASTMKDSWMFDWVKENVDLTLVEQFHGVYDPSIKAALFFVIRTGETAIDTCLAYFVERPLAEAWMILDNRAGASGYDAVCSALVREDIGTFRVYTGDASGDIWQLNNDLLADESVAYYAGFTTSNESCGNIRSNKMFNKLILSSRADTTTTMQIKMSIDDGERMKAAAVNISTANVPLGPLFLLGITMLATAKSSFSSVGIGIRGRRIQYEIYNNTTDEDFFISSYTTDFKPAGSSQQQV